MVQQAWEHWLGLGGPAGFVLGGGEPAEGAVRPARVVLDPPGLDDDLGFQHGAELLDVEQLVACPAVERLDAGVLPRRAGLDADGPRPRQAAPVPQGPGDELGPLSIRRKAGAPRSATSASMTATRSSAVQVRPTRMASVGGQEEMSRRVRLDV